MIRVKDRREEARKEGEDGSRGAWGAEMRKETRKGLVKRN